MATLMNPSAYGDDGDGAALRAVHAFLLDHATPLLLDSDADDDIENDAVAVSLQYASPPRRKVPSASSPVASHATSDSGGSSDSASPLGKAKLNPKAKLVSAPLPQPRQINRSRVRMQKERALLRQQTIALEAQLDAIKTQRPGHDAVAKTKRTDLLIAWETVALDQRTQREDAEQERDVLRDRIKEYTRSIKHVRRFLRRRVRPEAWTKVALYLSPPRAITAFTVDEGDDMVRRLTTMYAQRDAVFTNHSLRPRLLDGVTDVRIQHDVTPHMVAELRETRRIPYDAASTAEALWRHRCQRVASVSVGMQEEAYKADHASRHAFTATIMAPSYKGVINGRMETRRFVDGDRFLFLNCTEFTRAQRNEQDPQDQFGCRFLNWTIVRPLCYQEPSLAAGNSVCEMELFEVATPFRVGECRLDEAITNVSRQLRDFSLEGLEYVHLVEKQKLENLLLDMDRSRHGGFV